MSTSKLPENNESLVLLAMGLAADRAAGIFDVLQNEIIEQASQGNYERVAELANRASELKEFARQVTGLQEQWADKFFEYEKQLKAKDRTAGDEDDEPEQDEETQEPSEDSGITRRHIPRPKVPRTDAGSLPIEMRYGDAVANAEMRGHEVTVLPGSTIRKQSLSSIEDRVRFEKEKLVAAGKLVIAHDPSLYRLTTRVAFNSLSAAASFVGGCSLNGWLQWQIRGTQMTLDDWRARKLKDS